MTNLISSVFAIDVDGKPTVAFSASHSVSRTLELVYLVELDGVKMSEPLSLSIFTIEADRKPIMTFAAKKHQDAEAFFSDERVRARLQLATSGGAPVLGDRSILRVRMANARERALYRERTVGIATPGVVFLIDLDAE